MIEHLAGMQKALVQSPAPHTKKNQLQRLQSKNQWNKEMVRVRLISLRDRNDLVGEEW